METSVSSGLLSEVYPQLFLEVPHKEEILFLLEEMNEKISARHREYIEEYTKREFKKFFRIIGEDHLPPYESYWLIKRTEEKPVVQPGLFSKSMVEVEEIYRELGIVHQSIFSTPPDHLAFELSAFFTIRENEKKVQDDLKNKFVQDHFMRWVPKYLGKLSAKKGVFYPIVARYILKNIC